MLSYDEALARILAAADPLPAERVPLADARGRALAEPVVAPENLPPFDNSAVDGYAVLQVDSRDARPGHPTKVSERGNIMAGTVADTPLTGGMTYYVATGAPVPPGTEAMVMVEDTERGDFGTVYLSDPGSAKFIRRAGSDVRRGETVLEPGATLDAGAVGLLAALGVTRVPCHARPRVGLLTTGDEVVPPSTKTLAPGKIRDANGPALEAALAEAGAEVAARVHAADTLEAALEALDSLAGCDVIVSSGGVSVGAFDYVKEAFSRRGELDFWRIAIKPGKPLAFGRVGDALFFGLPGNPVSSLVTFELFVRPVLRRLSGHKTVLRPRIAATLSADLPHEPGRREFVRARVEWGEGGCFATPTGAQGSHCLSSMAGADALLVAHEDRGDYQAGETLPALLLP